MLLLTAAAGPADPEASERAAATQAAIEKAQANRQAAEAAAKEAAGAAAEAAGKRAALTKERVVASEKLRLAETAIEEMALRLDQLGQEQAKAKAALAVRERAFAPVLPLIERLSLYPAETLLAVPASPEDALRGVLVLKGIGAEIEREAAAILSQEAEVARISAEIATEQAAIADAESRQEAAAAALDKEIASAAASEEAARGQAASATARAAAEAARAKTLEGVLVTIRAAAARAEAARRAAAVRQAASAREEKVALARPPSPTPPSSLPASLPLGGSPVAGILVSAFGAPTPAGPATGIRYQTAPGAHVLAPCSGTVEFAAPFRSYGRLVILDCGQDYRFVLAGMQGLLVSAGGTVAAGEAIGVMAGWTPDSQVAHPTLYLELHHGGAAVNPLPWLHTRG